MHYNTGQDFVRETKCIPHCLLFLCKTGWQHCSVTAKTPLDFFQTHRCAVSHYQCTAALVKTKCIPHCPVLLCKTGWQHCSVTAKTPLNIFQTHRCAVSNHQCTAALVKTKCIPDCPVLLCKPSWQHCSVTAKTPLDISQTHRCAVTQYQCTAALVRTLSEKQNAFLTAFCFSAKQADSIVVSLQRHLWIFLKHTGVQCPITNADQCCSALVLGHCTPVCLRNIQRCLCSDTTMLSAWFAKQHRTVRNAFCLDQCCSALVMGHCTPVCLRNIQRCLCSDTTMLSACFAEKQKAVRNAFCFSDKVLTSAAVHWYWDTATPIWWANTQRSICSDTTMLSACFAEKQKAVRNAFCLDQCCSALVLGHCTPIWWANTQRSICSDTTMMSGLLCRETKGSEECILSWPVLQYTGIGSLHTCMMSRYLKVSLQWHYNAVSLFCRATQNSEECILSGPVLQCTGYWDTAHLYDEQIPKGLFVVTQQCCQPDLQRNKRQWGMHFVLTSAAVHWYWDTALLYDEQIPKGLFVVTQQWCQPVMQRNKRQSEECILSWPVLQYTGIGSLHTCMMSRYLKVSLQWHYNAVSLFCRATQNSEECILSWPVLQCTGTETLHTYMMSKYPKVYL